LILPCFNPDMCLSPQPLQVESAPTTPTASSSASTASAQVTPLSLSSRLYAKPWTCRNCGELFGSSEAIRLRSNHGYLLPIHTCMLQRVEFWFDGCTQSYLLVTPFNERPGEARMWWGCNCDDPAKMKDDACMDVYGRESEGGKRRRCSTGGGGGVGSKAECAVQ
jgi:hypothetical protein